jgi:plasmid segregation protein ParM
MNLFCLITGNRRYLGGNCAKTFINSLGMMSPFSLTKDLTMHRHLIVRAVDVGYGHIKFTNGRDPDTGLILTDGHPSQSPIARKPQSNSKVLSRRDTAIVPVGDRFFEVGKDVGLAMETYHEGDVLDQDFPLTDAYAARLFGALNYMYGGLGPDHVIDYLILGLPMTTINRHAAALEQRFVGPKTINALGHVVHIHCVEVFPQPVGSYVTYLAANPSAANVKKPRSLVVDPGYNTLDWYVVEGTTPSDLKSGAVQRGMGAVLRSAAEALIAPVEQGGAKEAQGGSVKEIERRLDQALTKDVPFTLCGHELDATRYLASGNMIIDEAAQAIKNSVGLGSDIDIIILTGGGATMYADAIKAKFPNHRVEILPDPSFANVRGFHFMGEKLARSAERATLSRTLSPA